MLITIASAIFWLEEKVKILYHQSAEQANIGPEEAAAAWIELQTKYPDAELVSPATAGVDTDWFDAFMAECEILGCRIDYLATHHYTAASADQMMKLLKN